MLKSALSKTMASIKMPVVAILGATGTGKSKLAIELAKKFNGEIVSADSMQVYKGLDIVTNKVTPEEENEAHHHFIGCIDSLKRYTVVDFQNQALPLINNLLKNGKLPIIVGGTNYYIESLLWDVLLPTEVEEGEELLLESEPKRQKLYDSSSFSKHKELFYEPITKDSFKDIPSEALHNALVDVDPVKATALHPNDKRKIIRSLQVYQTRQCCHSDLITQQKLQNGGSSLGGPLRYKNSVMFWIQCDKTVLNNRLDERVDKMIASGLIKELLAFHRAYNQDRLKADQNSNYEEGIFQSIGFKEFHDYLILSDEERTSDRGLKLFKDGVEAMKLHTRQYARKQNRWVTNRFLRTPDRDLPPVYGLDATKLEEWNEQVFSIAHNVLQSLLKGEECNIERLPVEEKKQDVAETYHCDICKRVFVGKNTWINHLASNKHYRRKQSIQKREAIAAYLAAKETSNEC